MPKPWSPRCWKHLCSKSWVQFAVVACVLAVAIPSVAILIVQLFPVATAAEKAQFRSEATALTLRLDQRLAGYKVSGVIRDLIEGVLSYNSSSCEESAFEQLLRTRDFYQTFAVPLIRESRWSMQSIDFVTALPDEETKNWWEIFGKMMYGANFTIRPYPTNATVADQSQRVTSSASNSTQVYYPIMYTAPEEKNLGVLGLDMATEPVRRKAIEKLLSQMSNNASTTGDTQSGELFVTSDPLLYEGLYGMGVLSPVRNGQGEVAGMIVAIFNFRELVGGMLEYRTGPQAVEGVVPMNVYLSDPTTGTMLYAHEEFAGEGADSSEGDQVARTTLSFVDRPLVLTIVRPEYTTSPVVLGVCVILIGTIAAMVAMLLWQMHLVRSVRKQHERTLEETTKRVAAEQASQTKNAFLSHMSHELRTPLNGMVGCCELLRETPLSTDQRDYVETMRACSEMLVNVVSDILDFSKIEAGRMVIEARDFDLNTVLRECFLVARFKAQAKGVKLRMEVGEGVQDKYVGDALRVQQVLNNYLDNAIKFTPATGCVSVRVDSFPYRLCNTVQEAASMYNSGRRDKEDKFAASMSADCVVDVDPSSESSLAPDNASAGQQVLRFHVKDTGIGIAPEDLARLFSPFVQTDGSITREYGGTGLGLSICRSLAQLMGGNAWAASEHGRGSNFFFTVLLSAAVPTTEPSVTTADTLVFSFDPKDGHHTPVMSPVANGRFRLPACTAQSPLSQPDSKVAGDADISSVSSAEALLSPEATPKLVTPPKALSRTTSKSELRRATTNTRKQSLGKPVVLVAEDNTVNMKVVTAMLMKYGVRVVQAWNGAEAVRACLESPFAIIFMDLQMPVCDGFTSARMIRTGDGPNRKTPIVAFTANVTESDRKKATEAGMNDVLTKPCTNGKLREALDQWLDSNRKTGDESQPMTGSEN